jgi:hypothetical protein
MMFAICSGVARARFPARMLIYRSPGHQVDGGSVAEILAVRSATK